MPSERAPRVIKEETPADTAPEVLGEEESLAVDEDSSASPLEAGASADEKSVRPEISHEHGFYEEELAEKLTNVELTGVRSVRDTVNYGVKQTIRGIEKAAHAPQDVKAYVKGRFLKARRDKTQRKHDRLVEKAQGSMIGLRRRRLIQKAEIQKKILGRRSKKLERHTTTINVRNKDREAALSGRERAYEEKAFRLLDKAEKARLRKAERRMWTLERLERSKSKRITPEVRTEIKLRQEALRPAIEHALAA